MQYIVIDTNMFYDNYFLKNYHFRLLHNYIHKRECALIMPKIIFDEIVNKHAEQSKEAIDNLKKFNKEILKLWNEDIPSKDEIENLKVKSKKYKNLLRKTLSENYGASIIDYPELSHEIVVDRALKRRKPFDDKGHDGYRDTLIWETIKIFGENKSGEIIFISGNTSDFANKKKTDFHNDLKSELGSNKFANIEFRFFKGLKDFVDKIINPTLNRVEEVEKQLSENEFYDIDMTDFIVDDVIETINEEYSNLLEHELNSDFDSPSISFCEDIDTDDYNIEDVREIDGEYIVNVSCSLDCIVDAFINKGEYYSTYFDESKIHMYDHDWSRHYVAVEIEVQLSLEFYFTIDMDTKEVTDIEILEIHADDNLIQC